MALVTNHLVRILESTSDVTTLEFATYALQSILQADHRASERVRVMLGSLSIVLVIVGCISFVAQTAGF